MGVCVHSTCYPQHYHRDRDRKGAITCWIRLYFILRLFKISAHWQSKNKKNTFLISLGGQHLLSLLRNHECKEKQEQCTHFWWELLPILKVMGSWEEEGNQRYCIVYAFPLAISNIFIFSVFSKLLFNLQNKWSFENYQKFELLENRNR